MIETPIIVDIGRGPQLSTSRITVQDLVPSIQRGRTYEEILELIPVLTVAEIQVVEQYVREHYDEVMEEDRLIREETARRTTPPELEAKLARAGEKMAQLRAEWLRKQAGVEQNGDYARG